MLNVSGKHMCLLSPWRAELERDCLTMKLQHGTKLQGCPCLSCLMWSPAGPILQGILLQSGCGLSAMTFNWMVVEVNKSIYSLGKHSSIVIWSTYKICACERGQLSKELYTAIWHIKSPPSSCLSSVALTSEGPSSSMLMKHSPSVT